MTKGTLSRLLFLCALVLAACAPGVVAQPAGESERKPTAAEIEALSARAVKLYVEGRYAEAVPDAERALALAEQAFGPDDLNVAVMLSNLGSLRQMLVQYEAAGALFERALAIREKALGPDAALVAESLNDVAEVKASAGDAVEAELLLRRALAIREKTDGPESAVVAKLLVNLGLAYMNRADPARAEPLLLRALAIHEKTGDETVGLGGTLDNLGKLYYENGGHERAKGYYERALAVFEKLYGPEHLELTTTLNNLATVHHARKDYARAEELYRRALSIREKVLGPAHPDVAAYTNNLAMLLAGAGEFGRAAPLFRQALAVREKALGPRHPDLKPVLFNLAVTYEATGDIARAVETRARYAEVSEHDLSLVLAAGSEKQKLLYLDKLVGETGAALSLHTRLAPDDAAALRLALSTVLRRKGRALDAMADQLGALRRRSNARDRELLDRLAAAQSELSALVLGGGESPTAEQRAEAAKLEAEIERLQDEAGRRSREFRAVAQPVTVEAVRAAVPEGAALVEFAVYMEFNPKGKSFSERWINGDRCVAYILKPGAEPRFVFLGSAHYIEGKINRLRAALKNPESGDVRALAREVDELVMRPVRAQLGGTTRLFVSPDGALNLVPFAALVDERGKYLVEDYTISYLTSGRDLLRLRETAASRQPPTVVADPQFGTATAGAATRPATPTTPQPTTPTTPQSTAPSTSDARRSADMGRMHFTRLPGTADEARALGAELHGVKLLTREHATEAALKSIAGPRVLHVATHGFFLPDQPRDLLEGARGADGDAAAANANENPLLRSGLALAGANTRASAGGEDGILTALEAAGLDLWGTKLVVLSACETGLGEVKNGDGVYGLRRALVLAGSESQVMTLWQVSDEATRDLMVSFYKRLRDGEGRTEALRRVQLEMLKGGAVAGGASRQLGGGAFGKSADRSHPYFWAAFIQSGAWRPMN